MSVGAEAVKVTDVGADVDVLFGIFDVLATLLVDNDLANEYPQYFGRHFFIFVYLYAVSKKRSTLVADALSSSIAFVIRGISP